MTQPQFSRAQLSSISRVADGPLTFWLRRALIRPSNDVAGKGNHKRFSLTEVKLAAFLREAHRAGMNIGAMDAIVQAFRRADELFSGLPHRMKGFGEAMSEARGNYGSIEGLLKYGHITKHQADLLSEIAKAISPERAEEFWFWLNFRDAEGVWVAALDEADRWILHYRTGDDTLETPFAIVFDCARILGPVHLAAQAAAEGEVPAGSYGG